MGVGWGEASGASLWNSSICMQERESVIELHVPGMCCAETRNCVWQLHMRKGLCKRCMKCGEWEEPEVTEWMTTALSQ